LMLKRDVLGQICDSGLIAVIRADDPEEAVRIADACRAGGAVALEITFTVPRAQNAIEQLRDRSDSKNCVVGAGTVLDPETARLAILSGARFIVSPALNLETAKLCNRYQIPYMPGASTVREVIEGMESGADIIKVFPGEVTGPPFVRAVKAALPQASLVPTGGVTVDNARDWISAGCVAVGAGSSLTRSAATGDFQTITNLTKRFIEEIRKARA
jgi:2-dehydro-3-deoxyphosphogluconate aldolase / (4S)-4-hydroxy-2-oxoglutarate aldolase